ncbi:RsmB/NOP family class I SAM-dependent RNA methyltransferase [Sphingomonas desiccabilis]|uniref:Methyltransferase domain-containing protein n=1 Tax=Sphingomonas desiccabilis TaxID=429134 RepID=A0A4V1QNS1_9SPHN|nr:transcription antitermination factor NusB [Sphingomonas desiccabilis]MBB3912247.1 16S rRNA (cytosine967-C5)-methyltransferase [Sphingomonas desiccabilis]RXZ30401.1 methyltransferase domain-containing protein [Sphingomonas desiccabilis]
MARPQLAPEPPGVPARRAALRLLDAVLRRGLALEAALDRATTGLDRREDRGLVHAIVSEALRRLPDLDALIDSATARPLPEDAKARFALRIALVQALALGTPPHAAIATVLPLVDGGPRKLVHGVFGTLMRRNATLPELPELPAAAWLRWQATWGEDVAEAARVAIASPPPVDLSLRGDTTAAEGMALLPRHRRVPAFATVPELPGFAEGEWWVQDLAASLPARLLGNGPGTALDLCAAPGGKTLQLAAAGWDVTALDVSEKRLARLSGNLERTGLSAKVIAADALKWKPREPVDALLLDAPCSATGIFRRHPDVLHRVRPAVITEAAELQARLLARAADWVKPGGRLVYATCSLEREEGEAQVERFLAEHADYRLVPAAPELLPEGIAPSPQGWVRTLPGMLAEQGGLDGFFIARLDRVG